MCRHEHFSTNLQPDYGRLLNSERISQLKDNTIVHVVNKLSGGGKRKDRKKAIQMDQSSTDKSSSEIDTAFAMREAYSKSGRNGWNEDLIQKMMGLDDEAMEDMMKKFKRSIRTSTDCGLESGIDESTLEGLRRLSHERRREARTQLEESLKKQQQAQYEEAAGETRRQEQREEAAEEARRQKQQEEAAEERRRQQQQEQEEETMREAKQQQEQGSDIRVTEEQQHTRRRSEVTNEMQLQMTKEQKQVGFGRDMGTTFGDVYKQDRQYCDWITRQETTNVHMIEFAQFIQQVDENWEDNGRELMMRELEEREHRLRTNKMAKSQEMDEKERQHVNSATGCSHDGTDDHAR